MTVRKVIMYTAFAAALAVVPTACSSSGSSASGSGTSGGSSGAPAAGATSSAGSTSGGKETVALVPGDSTDQFYLSMKEAGQKEATKLGMNFIWSGAATFSPEDQQPVLAALLAKHPSALIVAPTDPKALTGTFEQFKKAGIPVITVDTTISDTSLLTSRITSDNTQGGTEAADSCGKAMKGTGSAGVIYTTPGTTTTNERGKGFIAEMKAKYPKIKVYTEFDGNNQSKATSQVSSLILAHSDLGCVFGTNEFAAEGAATAIGNAHAQSKVALVGYDAEPTMVQLLKQGKINFIVAQKPALEATTAVEYAHDALTGKTSAIKKSVKLPNVVMTKQNINNPNVSKWIYK